MNILVNWSIAWIAGWRPSEVAN